MERLVYMRNPMTFRKLAGLVAALALLMAPALPAADGASSLFGVVPTGMRNSTSEVVSERVGGQRVSSMPTPTDGRFTFANLPAGDYVVRLMGPAGETVAQSQVARVQPDTSTEAVFEEYRPAPASAFVTRGGPSKGLLIVGGAMVAGVGTAIVLTGDDEPAPASPSR